MPGRARGWGIAAAVCAAIFLLPLTAMLLGALRQPGLPPPLGLELLPASPSLEGLRSAFAYVELGRAVLNSLLVSTLSVPLAVLTASWAGFGLSRLDPRRRARWIFFLLVVLMVPVSAVWLARFAMFRWTGLTDTYVPLVIPALLGGSPVFVLLYLLAFRRVPREILDAAQLEGAGPWLSWRSVAMPLVRGTTVAVALMAFGLSWADFINPLLYLSRDELATAPLVLRSLQQLGETNWPVILSGATVVTFPVVVAFAAGLRLIVGRRGVGWLGS